MSVDFHILIPARLDSTRLAQKALADIAGRPLIVHVLERALDSGASSVQVATDSDRIAEAVLAAGGRVVMTAPGHRSGTDRLAEAVELGNFSDQDIVVNLQGDEPGMPASCLQQVAELLAADTDASMATLWQAIESTREWSDPNVVKLVVDNLGRALYFSRAPIPHSRDAGWPEQQARRHVGLYAYRAGALRQWTRLPASPLEQLESLEQLRALQAGWVIVTDRACRSIPPGIDTADDLARFRTLVDGTVA